MGNLCNRDVEDEYTSISRPTQRIRKLSIKNYPMSSFDDETLSQSTPRSRREGNTTAVNKHISFKHLRGFRQVKDIKKMYEWEKELGAGQFGTVH